MKNGLFASLILFHERRSAVRHTEDVGRVGIAVFMSVLVADVAIAFVVAVRRGPPPLMCHLP